MVWSELQNNITGIRDSHLSHIIAQCPSVSIKCMGTASAALAGEARLHLVVSSTNEVEFRKAKTLVEDLIKAVIEVGSEVCFPDDDKMRSQMVRDVRVVALSGTVSPQPASSFSSLLGALAAARAAKK